MATAKGERTQWIQQKWGGMIYEDEEEVKADRCVFLFPSDKEEEEQTLNLGGIEFNQIGEKMKEWLWSRIGEEVRKTPECRR